MAEQSGEKTFDATPHRREQAREKGQVAYSQDLGSAALLLVAAGLLMTFGQGVVETAALIMQRQLSEFVSFDVSRDLLLVQARNCVMKMAMALLPFFGLLALSATLASISQTGLLFVPQKLQPDFSRLSPLQGFKRIFSLQGTMRLSFGLFKVVVVAAVSAVIIAYRSDDIMASSALSVGEIGRLTTEVVISALLWAGLALFLLALADFAFQRWKHEQDLKMTQQEVREEMKNLQGDPQVVARRKQIQRQMALNRMGESVPQADVVVTNPTELAVAMKYEPETMAAPIVVAKGAGVIAQRIRRLALENNVPIVERKPLAQLLYKQVEINHPVPDESYAAVAEVLAYVYQLKGKKPPLPPTAA